LHIKPNEQNSNQDRNQEENKIINKSKRTASPYRVAAEYVALLLVVVIPLSVQAGIFDNNSIKKINLDTDVLDAPHSDSPIEAPVLSSLQNPNPQVSRGGAEVLVNESTLVSSGPVSEDVISSTRTSSGEISIYTVRSGDTISHIADMYGVTVNTIMWANDLTKATSIREGQTLVILPIVGVRHTVKKGDTLSTIAKKYEGDADEILAYNQLESADGLDIGSIVVVPGGAMHTAPVVVTAKPVRTSGGTSSGGSWMTHPAPGSTKTQGIHGYNGIDMGAPVGTPVRAAAAGKVIVSKASGWNGGYGQYIVVRHSNGAQTLYAHLSRNNVGVGAYVSQGQVIGGMGNTGKSTGSHLHFEVRGGSNPF
jgi:LysM repeat protein